MGFAKEKYLSNIDRTLDVSISLQCSSRLDCTESDGVTMVPCEMGKQLVWKITAVDALAPSGLNQSSLCNPATIATEGDVRNIEKDREIIDNG